MAKQIAKMKAAEPIYAATQISRISNDLDFLGLRCEKNIPNVYIKTRSENNNASFRRVYHFDM